MFTIRSYSSDERFDLAKLMDYKVDVYDVINSPFLNKIKELPITRYYDVNNGYKDIDRISIDVYGSPFYSYLIQFYNDLQVETIEEDTVLRLFSLDDLESLYYNLSNGIV